MPGTAGNRAEPRRWGSDIAQAPARGADLGLLVMRSPARAHGGHAQAQALAAGGLEFTINGARIWCGQGAFAHSLVKPGGLLKAKHSKRHEHPSIRSSDHNHLTPED